MSDLENFIEFVNYAKRYREVGPRRYLRDYSDPFSKYSSQEFHARYRFTPESVKNVLLPLLASDLRRPTNRGLPFAPEIMLLITLRYFATGSVQKLEVDFMDICQQSISRIVAQVSTLIASKMKYFVKFPPTAEQINMVKQKFYEVAHFPEVIGCIGCTHIKIKSPGGLFSEAYRNGNGWFSINVQAVIGPNLEFCDLVARWPGSTHNNIIYDNSSIKQRLDRGVLQGTILGPNSYAVSEVLLTPFSFPNSTSQQNYNESLCKTRCCVERCFGVWKSRFPCLQVGMGIKLDTVVAVICACATLHNIALKANDFVDWNDIDDIVDVASIDESNISILRESFVERFFS